MTQHISKSPLRSINVLRSPRSNAGFTLIEILVSMVVLAIGLLGVAAMQLRGLQYSHDAYLRSQISVLAYGMADRMRLNKANAAAYYASIFIVPTTAPGRCANAAVGAVNDLACWHLAVFTALPPGSQADIVQEVALPGEAPEFTIALGWTDRSGDPPRIVEYTFLP